MYGNLDVRDVFRIKSLHTAFEEQFESNYDFPGERHDFWEIVIVLEGEIGIVAESEVYILKKGQAVIHEPMEFHRLWSEGNSRPRIIIFSFGADGMPKFSAKVFEILDLKSPMKILEQIKNAYETSKMNVEKVKESDGVAYQLALKKLELFILNTISQKIRKNSTEKPKTAKNYATIVNVMENNIENNLSVAQIARLCNMSEISLKKTFSKYSGMGVMAYFNNMKITAAIDMIKNGMTVQETANKLGFSNQNYFSTVFKRITGMPPSAYK